MKLLTVAGSLFLVTGCQSLGIRSPEPGSPRPTTAATLGDVRSEPITEENRLSFLLDIADSFEQRGSLGQAITTYEAVLQRDSENEVARHRLAVLYVRKGDFSKALSTFEAAIERQPENAELLCDLAYCYYLMRDYPRAESTLIATLEIAPGLQRAHMNMAMVFAYTGRQVSGGGGWPDASVGGARSDNLFRAGVPIR